VFSVISARNWLLPLVMKSERSIQHFFNYYVRPSPFLLPKTFAILSRLSVFFSADVRARNRQDPRATRPTSSKLERSSSPRRYHQPLSRSTGSSSSPSSRFCFKRVLTLPVSAALLLQPRSTSNPASKTSFHPPRRRVRHRRSSSGEPRSSDPVFRI